MKRLLLGLVILGFVLITTGQTTKQVENTQQWEYKFDFSTTEKKANELGMQGWELVAIQSTGPGLGNNVSTYVFKRIRQGK